MQRLIAVLSLAVATPVLAQQPFGPTDPIMPACVTDAVMAAAGGTVVSADHTRAQGEGQESSGTSSSTATISTPVLKPPEAALRTARPRRRQGERAAPRF